MKMKLTSLMFGLLLAVGWTSSAYAQLSPNNIPDAVHPKSYYDALTYTWEDPTDGEGPHISKSTDLATNPYQIYELLRFVYGNPAFPGPKYGAYTSSFVREDPIEYGPIQGGWNIVAAGNSNPRDIVIIPSGIAVNFTSIQITSGGTPIEGCSWNSSNNGTTLPSGWSGTMSYYYGDYYCSSGSITIPASLFTDYSSVDVIINAFGDNANQTISVNNISKPITTSNNEYEWNITLPEEGAFVQGTVATPNEEGYTALMVSVKNEATAAEESGTGITGDRQTGSYFNTKQGYVNYIAERFKSVQLLTDGMRIGDAAEHTSGTVFNCSGTYNKFFIISKGQAREKSDYTMSRINSGRYPWYAGEVFPFQTMYEQFSPTSVDKGADIKDFYNEMMSGHVYSVVHDCASVIQEGHQFSMSGNTGTQEYAMSGLNFFIPDYRLLFWTDTYSGITIDGRDINPYMRANDNGHTTAFDSGDYWSCWFGNYNPDYAPKIGIYKISLEATAKKSADYDANDESKRNYDVTLNWVSSLNEMTGDLVPQTYEIYIITYEVVKDAEGNPTGEVKEVQTLFKTVKDETSYTYQVPQEEQSKTITYIIKGYPTPDEGNTPSFVAWSNVDDVIIPGLTDFLALILDHYESDFVIGDKLGAEKNYYRNFLHVASDDDGEKALTTKRINDGEKEFTLYRYNVATPNNQDKVGVLTFTDREDGKNVGYDFKFASGQEVEYYHLQKPAVYKKENGQNVLVKPAADIDNAYDHAKLGMPMDNAGSNLRIKGNGDIIIQPTDYAVNFKEISVYNGSTRIAHWAQNETNAGNLASYGWIVSPGSRWIKDYNTDYYYLEGGGYIAIPDMMNNNNYDNLRVVVNAFGDAGNITYIAVNDHRQNIKNATDNNQNAQNYTWNVDSKKYKYVRVTSASELTNGEYLIVNQDSQHESGNYVAFNGSAGNLDAVNNNINVTIEHNEIASSTLVDNATFTIDFTAGSIKSISGYYIGHTGSKNGLKQSTTSDFTNSITVNEIEATIVCNDYYLRFNAQSGQNRFRYLKGANEQPIQLYKKVADNQTATDAPQVVRLGALPIIDQFAVNVSKNEHPARYAYVLKYEPKAGVDPTSEAAKAKTSSVVEVPVHHTASVTDGYYTETQVKNDTVRKLQLDVMSADLQMNLSATNSAAYYYSILSSKTEMPKIDTDSTYYVSNMQNDNFTYQEMFTRSDQRGHRYAAGEHHFYDSIPAVGTYGKSYKTYVPFITSRAEERFYFATDSLHNTYGSPVWATGVGQVINMSAEAQPQKGWNTTWKDGNDNCRLYMLDSVTVDGYLPNALVTNIEYEPYMFRIFVESENGKLRHFKYETDNNGNRVITAGEGSTTGPWRVWDEYITLDKNGDIVEDATTQANGVSFKQTGNVITFNKVKVKRDATPEATDDNPNPEMPAWDKDEENAIFGAVDNLGTEGQLINEKDLKVYVRFYYKSTGKPIETENLMFKADGVKEIPLFHAVEGATTLKRVPTAVNEVQYLGEIVSQTYYNVQGMVSDKPFDGVNIVVTRFGNGTTSVSKIVK